MKRILITGGGIIGLSVAWYCQKHGHHVTIVDRKPQQRDGCSFGNAGMLVPSHVIPLAAPGMVGLGLRMMRNPESPFYIRPRLSTDLVRWLWRFNQACTQRHVDQSAPLLRDLHLRSRQLFVELEDELPGGFGLQTRGLLMLCKTQAGLKEESETAKIANRLGVPAEVHDAESTNELDPGIEMDVVGSVYYPKDCHLSPNQLMSKLQSEIQQRGGQFVWESETKSFDKEGNRIVAAKTDQGSIEADHFVICGGVWSSDLVRSLKLSLPMQAGKGYSVTLEGPKQLPEICSLLHEARVAVTPMGSSLRVGGTMEIAGIDESVTQSRVRGILKSIPGYFPQLSADDFSGLPTWSGLRPCSPDGLPYLGKTNRWSNLAVATGHAMMGVSLALVSGQVISDLIESKSPKIDRLDLLSPDRY